MFDPFVAVVAIFALLAIFVVVFVLIIERDVRKELHEICENSFLWTKQLEDEIKQLNAQIKKK